MKELLVCKYLETDSKGQIVLVAYLQEKSTSIKNILTCATNCAPAMAGG